MAILPLIRLLFFIPSLWCRGYQAGNRIGHVARLVDRHETHLVAITDGISRHVHGHGVLGITGGLCGVGGSCKRDGGRNGRGQGRRRLLGRRLLQMRRCPCCRPWAPGGRRGLGSPQASAGVAWLPREHPN